MDERDGSAVPAGRLRRLAGMAKLAGGVAGGMLAEGERQLRAGKRPRARDMLLTPGNARRVTKQLARMRGAAMKLGQILSMDTGDLLPRELAEILARLRADAESMPARQLQEALHQAFGPDWDPALFEFEWRPLAAASIGQVHRIRTRDGRAAVLKIQYPGVADSIDSDVDNIATLLRMSGLLPRHLDLQPLLLDARAQLKDEADYLKEAKYLNRFREALAHDQRFVLPEVLPDLTRRNVLGMTYVDGESIETLALQPAAERDRVMSALIELLLTEMFELRLVQTDPNFANYQYRERDGAIVLLDFGASRPFKAAFVRDYGKLAAAAMAGDRERVAWAAERVGYAMGEPGSRYRELVLDMLLLALEPLRQEGPYDFGASDMPSRLMAMGQSVTGFRDFWQAPPTHAVYFHRKLGGMFMLAHRLRARVDVRGLMAQRVKS
ncbi:MAG: AarF/ABC1/UbiB kinase family protein [Haliea sp.]|uniref:ABC1 kinase family protein n=1 Tax=Haliea sp. TaxID=1932666 RepID=UPI0032EDBF2A